MEREEFLHIETLCQIECSEEEKKILFSDLQKIVTLIKSLQEIDTEGVDPCYSPFDHFFTPLREDDPVEKLDQRALLDNAPDTIGGFVKVPTVIEDR